MKKRVRAGRNCIILMHLLVTKEENKMKMSKGNIKKQEGQFSEEPWYAVRTFNCQEQKVSQFLAERDIVHFIPMALRTKVKDNETEKRILVPAIHNLLFVQKQGSQQQMLQLFKECALPLSPFRHPGSDTICEIPSREMIELRMLCDPQFKTSVFFTQTEAEGLIGKDVRVINGPFKGSIGKLIRKKGNYYFLKIVIGMGVMVRISRWYCEPL